MGRRENRLGAAVAAGGEQFEGAAGEWREACACG
jgi:hypothetical protein